MPSKSYISPFESSELVVNIDKPLVTITGKTYNSVDEYLKDIHNNVYNILTSLVKEAQGFQQSGSSVGPQTDDYGGLNPLPGNGAGVNGKGINSANAGSFGIPDFTADGGMGKGPSGINDFSIPFIKKADSPNPDIGSDKGNGKNTVKKAGTIQEKKDTKKQEKKQTKIVPQAAPPRVQLDIIKPDGGHMKILGDATVEKFDKDPGTVWGNVKLHVAKNSVRAFNTGGKRYVAGFDKQGKFTGYFLNKDMKTLYEKLGTIENMMADDPTRKALENAAKQTGVDIADLEAMAMIESTGMRTTKKGGLLQVKSGALGQVNKNEKTKISASTIQSDINTNALVGAKYLKYVSEQITNKDNPNPSLVDKYLAYQQGPPAFKELMKGIKDSTDAKVTPHQLDNLPTIIDKDTKKRIYNENTTQQEYYNYWKNRVADVQSQVTAYTNKK